MFFEWGTKSIEIRYDSIADAANNLNQVMVELETLITELEKTRNAINDENTGMAIRELVARFDKEILKVKGRYNEVKNVVIILENSFKDLYHHIKPIDIGKKTTVSSESVAKEVTNFKETITNKINSSIRFLGTRPSFISNIELEVTDKERRAFEHNKVQLDHAKDLVGNLSVKLNERIEDIRDINVYFKQFEDVEEYYANITKDFKISDDEISEEMIEISNKYTIDQISQIEHGVGQLSIEMSDWLYEYFVNELGMPSDEFYKLFSEEVLYDIMFFVLDYLSEPENLQGLKNIGQFLSTIVAGLLKVASPFAPIFNAISDKYGKDVLDIFLNDFITRLLGFQVSPDGTHITTSETSLQSASGFMDIYDELGPILGMDLNTEVIIFVYDGREYRFQLWEGTYGFNTMIGGEMGLYYRPLSVANKLPYSDEDNGSNDFLYYAAVDEADHIPINVTIYDNKGNIITNNDTKDYTANDNHYWNAQFRSNNGLRDKDDVYMEGTVVMAPAMADSFIAGLEGQNIQYTVKDITVNGQIEKEITLIWGK